MDVSAEENGSRATFDGRTVLIERYSGVAKRLFGERSVSIPVEQIGSVEWKTPGRLSVGHIRFAVAGSPAGALPVRPGRDTHAVTFSRKHVKDFEVLRDAVRQALAARTAR
jgi:hypothetical protein